MLTPGSLDWTLARRAAPEQPPPSLTGSRPPRWHPAGPGRGLTRTPRSRSPGSPGAGRRCARHGCPCTRRTRGSARRGGATPAGCTPGGRPRFPCPASLKTNPKRGDSGGRALGSCHHPGAHSWGSLKIPAGRMMFSGLQCKGLTLFLTFRGFCMGVCIL